MKKFFLKLGLFLLPFIIVIAVELFVLPVDFFTFRVWEAIRVEGTSLTPGKFYPCMHIEKEEVGRFAHHTKYEVKKKCTWITDQYGYRKAPTDKKINIVIVGDSFVAGDGLDQQEMLSERLEKRLGMGVYPVATANINDFLNMPKFYNNPPSIVILEKLEETTQRLKRIKEKPFKRFSWSIRQKLCENSVIRFIDITQNRASKAIFLHYLQARIRDWMGLRTFNSSSVKQLGDKPFIIIPPGVSDKDKKAKLDKIISQLVKYRDMFSKRGIRFIFMPMPVKSTIYHHIAGLEEEPTFLNELVAAAEEAGIEVIDLKDAFNKALEQNSNLMLYIADDSHWNGQGVKIATELLVEQIQNTTLTKSGGSIPNEDSFIPAFAE